MIFAAAPVVLALFPHPPPFVGTRSRFLRLRRQVDSTINPVETNAWRLLLSSWTTFSHPSHAPGHAVVRSLHASTLRRHHVADEVDQRSRWIILPRSARRIGRTDKRPPSRPIRTPYHIPHNHRSKSPTQIPSKRAEIPSSRAIATVGAVSALIQEHGIRKVCLKGLSRTRGCREASAAEALRRTVTSPNAR